MGAKEVLTPIATFLGGVIITGGAFLIPMKRNAKKLGLPVLIATDEDKMNIKFIKQYGELLKELNANKPTVENVPGLKLNDENKLVKGTANDSVPVAAFNAAIRTKKFNETDTIYIDDCAHTANAKALIEAVQKSPTLKNSFLGLWINFGILLQPPQ